MKKNLELNKHKQIKTFKFSINKPYEKEIIGYGPYKSTFNASKYKTKPVEEKNTKSCGLNEELGADGVSCVCKYGYTKNNGVCVSDDELYSNKKDEEDEDEGANNNIDDEDSNNTGTDTDINDNTGGSQTPTTPSGETNPSVPTE